MSSSSVIRPKTVGLAILYPLRCSIGSTARPVTGLRNLFECQLRRQRPRLRPPDIPHHTTDHDQIRIIEGRTIAVVHAIPQLPALMDRPRRLRRYVDSESPRKEKCLNNFFMPASVLGMFG